MVVRDSLIQWSDGVGERRDALATVRQRQEQPSEEHPRVLAALVQCQRSTLGLEYKNPQEVS